MSRITSPIVFSSLYAGIVTTRFIYNPNLKLAIFFGFNSLVCPIERLSVIFFRIPIFPQIPLIRPHQVPRRPDVDVDAVDDPVADVAALADLEPDRVGE